jgi:hypothetical protein
MKTNIFMETHTVNMEVYFGSDVIQYSCGVLINNLHILTLASNLYNRRTNRPANKINIYLAKSGIQLLCKQFVNR